MSEFFADELAMVLNCSRSEATRLADAAGLLVGVRRGVDPCVAPAGVLAGTWAALADGGLDWPRARAIAAELLAPARETEPGVLAAVEAAVLAQAGRLSVPGVRAVVRRELARHDAGASDRRRARAARGADVTAHRAADGMGELRVFAPFPQIAALARTVDGYARLARTGGDRRPIGVLRAEVLHDLVTRPWDTGRAAVSAQLTVFAPLPTLRAAAAGHDACALAHTPAHHPGPGSGPGGGPSGGHGVGAGSNGACPGCGGGVAPAEVDGQPITAAHLRELLEQLDALCPGGLQAPAAGSLQIALTDPAGGVLRAVVTRAELARLARRGCPRHPDADCGCPVLGRPSPVDRWRHDRAQERFVTTRDRTCRHPGCATRAGWADLDHVLAHAQGGETACENLCCLCRRHHRLKTHAPGWSFVMDEHGVLTVTTPSGVTRITRPPGMADPDDPPPF